MPFPYRYTTRRETFKSYLDFLFLSPFPCSPEERAADCMILPWADVGIERVCGVQGFGFGTNGQNWLQNGVME